MSLNIGRLFDNSNTFGQILDTAATKQTPPPDVITERYKGGTLSVAIKPNDTQQTFVHRALAAHGTAAGLSNADAQEFADKWTSSNTTFNHRGYGQSTPFTDAEFRALKTRGRADHDLTKEYDAEILTDLNQRAAANTIDGGTATAFEAPSAPSATAAAETLKAQGAAARVALAAKPMATLIDSKDKNGNAMTADAALLGYVKNNYEQAGRVWGDKMNELVEQAKLQGVKVELLPNGEEKTAVVVSATDKQKLDRLFAQALSETVKGEQASDKGQQEATNQVGDTGKMYVNGAINTVNHLTEPVRGALAMGGFDTSAAKIPKLEYQSEIGKKYGSAGEIGTEIGIGVVSAPVLLKTAAGKATLATSGVYNIATGAAGIDPTERDKQGKGREMTTVERGLRIAGGVLEAAGGVSGAGEEAATLGKAGRQTAETVEVLADTGTGVKVPVKVKVSTTTEAAIERAGAKPAQTAEDLVFEMRGEHRINIRKGDGTKSSGMEYAWRRHGGSGSLINKSQFSISREEVEGILQSKDAIKSSPVLDAKSGNYIRQFDVGKTVGNVPLKQGGHSTSVITIITDEAGI